MANPFAVIVVLSWNNSRDLLECLESLRHLEYDNNRVVVVDNGSTDDTVARVREKFPNVHLIENNHNLGFAEGNNVGIRYALNHAAEYVLLLNDDTTVESDTISKLIQIGESDVRIGMLGPAIVSYFDHAHVYIGASIDWRTGMTAYVPAADATNVDADYLAGCALLVKARLAHEIGLLDTDYFAYFEDADWCMRARRAGYRVVTVSPSKIYHKGTPDNIRHESSALLFYYSRNQYLFMRKYAPRSAWRHFMSRYISRCFQHYSVFARANETSKAKAVLDGFWAGVTGHYGESCATAPRWFARVISTWINLQALSARL